MLSHQGLDVSIVVVTPGVEIRLTPRQLSQNNQENIVFFLHAPHWPSLTATATTTDVVTVVVLDGVRNQSGRLLRRYRVFFDQSDFEKQRGTTRDPSVGCAL